MTEGSKSGPSHLWLYTLITLMTLFWSLNYIIAKYALRELPPTFTAGARIILAGVFILPLYAWRTRRAGGRDWTRADVPRLLLMALFGVALNGLFFVLGIAQTSVAHAALMIGTAPVMVLLLATYTGLEHLSGGRIIGMAVALAGVAWLQFSSGGVSGATLLGDVIVLLGALAFAIFTVIGKGVSGRFSSVTMNTFAYVGGGLMLLPLTLWDSGGVAWGSVSAEAWISVIYMALFPSMLCYLIYYYALTHIPASRVIVFSYLQPVLATLMAIPLLGERPTIGLVGGGALVLAGVILTERL